MRKSRGLTAPLKDWVRAELHRRGYELLVDPFGHRLVRTLDWLGVDTVIDGGANEGQTGEQLRTSGYAGRIISLEPLKAAHAHLEERAANDPAWHVERAALGGEEGSIDINISGNSVSSSILPMLSEHSDAAPESVYVGVETVPMTTLASILDRYEVDPAHTLLKLDVQGYESTIIQSEGARMSDFAAVQLELSFVPLYGGSWLANQTEEFMTALGYELWMLDPAAMHDPRTGRLMQCDGVFVRS